MKTLSLRPYPGTVIVCETREEFRKTHKRVFKSRDHGLSDFHRGRMVGHYDEKKRQRTFLIWGETTGALAHEVAHVIFSVFDNAGIPTDMANDEAFCYLLDTLLTEAMA